MFNEFSWTKASEQRNELTNRHEPIQIDLLRSLSAHCDEAVFLDIGANIGAYSIVMSKDPVFSEIYAFEAVETLATELQKNVKLNGLTNRIEVHNTVLSDEAGDVDFVNRGDFAGDGGVRATHYFDSLPSDRIMTLQRRPLDELIKIKNRHIVGKIDVEGHEAEVLRGAKAILKNNSGFLQIEILTEHAFANVEDFLGKLGWLKLFKIDNDYYFSNCDEYLTLERRLGLLERGVAAFIARNRDYISRPARRRLLPGVFIEVQRSYADRLKRILCRRV